MPDYRVLQAYPPFDKITSVGMFERVDQSRQMEYIQSAYRSLRDGDLFLYSGIGAQTIIQPGWMERVFLQHNKFMNRYVFPDDVLLNMHPAMAFAEQSGFEVRDVESLREHYALTLRPLG